MWAVSESAMPLTNFVKGTLGACVSVGEQCEQTDHLSGKIVLRTWHPHRMHFFCLWASSSLLPWTDSPFGSAVHIAHLLTELQGWSTGALGVGSEAHSRSTLGQQCRNSPWNTRMGLSHVLEHGDSMMAVGRTVLARCAGPAVLLLGWAQPGMLPRTQLGGAAVPCPVRRVNVMGAQSRISHNFSFK